MAGGFYATQDLEPSWPWRFDTADGLWHVRNTIAASRTWCGKPTSFYQFTNWIQYNAVPDGRVCQQCHSEVLRRAETVRALQRMNQAMISPTHFSVGSPTGSKGRTPLPASTDKNVRQPGRWRTRVVLLLLIGTVAFLGTFAYASVPHRKPLGIAKRIRRAVRHRP